MQKLSQFSISQVGNLRNDAYFPYQREAPSLGCASYILRPSKKHYYTRVYFDDSFPFWKNIIKYGWDAQQQVDISNISSIVNHSAQYRSWVILNDSVWSYMMEINISVCNLTYLGVNGNLQGQKLVKGEPKVPFLPPKIPIIQSGVWLFCRDTSITIRYAWNWCASMCFDLIGGLW